MSAADDIIAALTAAAAQAEVRESAFRAEAATTAQRLETERATAFRRLNFMRALAQSAAAAPTDDEAQAGARAHVRAVFGWDTESEARTQVLERIGAVATALFAATHGPDQLCESAVGRNPAVEVGEQGVLAPIDPLAALSAFESWYEQTRASSFWFLFEHYMPETPRVDY